jgi:hypothetical protein
MKNVFFLFTVIFSSQLMGQKAAINFTIMQTNPYCGGAAPTQEMMDESQKPKPYANKKLYVYKNGRCLDSSTSNDLGVFSVQLNSGVYQLYEPWKHFKTGPYGDAKSEYDPVCLKKEWTKADVSIRVKKGKKSIMSNMTSVGLCQWQYPCRLNKEMPPMIKPR